MLFLNSWGTSVILYSVTILTLQLFKNSIDTQAKLRLNLHSLSVSASELWEYGRMSYCNIQVDTMQNEFGKRHSRLFQNETFLKIITICSHKVSCSIIDLPITFSQNFPEKFAGQIQLKPSSLSHGLSTHFPSFLQSLFLEHFDVCNERWYQNITNKYRVPPS